VANGTSRIEFCFRVHVESLSKKSALFAKQWAQIVTGPYR
jgi:hypothetical protein